MVFLPLSWMYPHQLQSCTTCTWTQGGAIRERTFFWCLIRAAACGEKAEQVEVLNREGGIQVLVVCLCSVSHRTPSSLSSFSTVLRYSADVCLQSFFNDGFYQIFFFFWCFMDFFPICVSSSVICWWNVLELWLSKDVNPTQKQLSFIVIGR